jgi:membrane-associated PAP2 superfamily phosphatase
MRRILHIFIPAVALVGVLVLFECTDLDLAVQDRFYDFQAQRWIVDRDEPVARMIFYTGPKVAAVAVGVACGAVGLLSLWRRRLAPYRRGCLLMMLSLIFVPLIVAGSKQFTNVYTPRQIERYGGSNPYVKVLQRYPPGFHPTKPGKGFPAGHATGGFAFMMLYFVLSRRCWKWFGLSAGLAAGWAMGLYQTFNGEHYLSHTLVTMLAAWIIIVMLSELLASVRPPRGRSAADDGSP